VIERKMPLLSRRMEREQCCPRRLPGFTMVELVVFISVFVLMLLIAMPMFNRVIAQRRLMGAVERVSTDLRYLQSQAVRDASNNRYRLNYNAGTKTYTLQKEGPANTWTTFVEAYSVARDYTGVSLASIVDNNGAGVNQATITFKSQGDADPTGGINFPIVLTVTAPAGTRTITVTRAGGVRMPTN